MSQTDLKTTALQQTAFEPLLLDREKRKKEISLSENPYFYNDQGAPSYLMNVPSHAQLIEKPTIHMKARLGKQYKVRQQLGSSNSPEFGMQTQLDFEGEYFEYEAMWATADTAAAFGITLIQPGQAIRIVNESPHLAHIDYEYGKYAGYWCPYLEAGLTAGKTLFPFVSTDLEHHDFPHIFASTDQELPLVISVARYFPKDGKIYLADLWVKRGDALYIPPKPIDQLKFIDLHNNRNSALACWGGVNNQLQSHGMARKTAIETETLLQEDGYFYWYWNKKRTVHHQLLLKP
ncbi:hypothetical protein [Acinetobacter sp. ANC 3813]|uniref:hypothetical protein n=1 Tax=Acinetobacter sp. ANC 3813 TaxID=1977873 RepID=UPI000A34A1CB|nr:hypothetical protein [Acinetobacter sp. ANC 3813]OTG92105.1 hypothetical protein B9T34_01870 [Acinetobacter sp. ANC 3813]